MSPFRPETNEAHLKSSFGRVPTSDHPEPTGQNKARTIQPKRYHGSSANFGSSIDPRGAFRQEEMLRPLLLAWVEQLHQGTCLGIDRRNPAALMIVTKRTGEPEIPFCCRPTERSRKEVIEFHGRADDGLLSQTIAAAVTRLLNNTPPEMGRYIN